MVEAVHTGFPPSQLAFALQQHAAPRALQAKGYSSKPIRVCKSFLAGCKYSCPINRSYLQRSMTQIAEEHPKAHPELFIDDTSMHN